MSMWKTSNIFFVFAAIVLIIGVIIVIQMNLMNDADILTNTGRFQRTQMLIPLSISLISFAIFFYGRERDMEIEY